MKIKRLKDAQGAWVDEHGQRWSLLVVRRLRNAAGVNVGFKEFESVEDALVAWGLREAAPDEKVN